MTAGKTPLTAFVVTHGRPALLARCLESVLSALPPDGEVRVVVNGPCAESESWLSGRADPRLSWRVCPRMPRTACRNRAFDESRGEILHFLDDDVVVPPDFFGRVLGRFSQDRTLAVLGGPNLTPPDSRFWERAFGGVMSSPFAAPLVFRRYSAGRSLADRPADERQLILCNLALRLSVFPKYLRFQEHLRSNEENLFLYECRLKGLKSLHSPACFVWHRRRSSLAQFFGQVSSYGFGRSQQTVLVPASCHPLFLVPAAALGSLLALGWALPWGGALGLLAVYGGASALGAALSEDVRALGPGGWAASALLTPVVHAAYGMGFWRGLLAEKLRPLSDRAAVFADAQARRRRLLERPREGPDGGLVRGEGGAADETAARP